MSFDIAAGKWLIFIFGTLALALFSRGSLASFRAHGFYRFFAFEAILGLILLNADVWFNDPFSAWQIVSWVLLLVSIFLAAHGFALLRRIGEPDASINDPTRLGIEKTTHLVMVGAYRYIRHPLYASLLCFGWGAFFKQPALLGAALVAIVTIALYATARVEEAENQRLFGAEYEGYIRRTKMFIPFVW